MRRILFLLYLITYQTVCMAIEPPNDVDLKAAYCASVRNVWADEAIPMLEQSIRDWRRRHSQELQSINSYDMSENEKEKRRTLAKEFLASMEPIYTKALLDIQDAQDRINTYLLSRVGRLNATGLLAAAKRGKSDALAHSINHKACVQPCKQSDSACFNDCRKNSSAAGERTQICNSMTFLPF